VGQLGLPQLLFVVVVITILWSLLGSHDGRFRGCPLALEADSTPAPTGFNSSPEESRPDSTPAA
jgi:hypothetical protein